MMQRTLASIVLLLNLTLFATADSPPFFITHPCQSDAECASGCCGFKTGLCAGAIVALERDGGCGFGNAQPNDNEARILRGMAAQTSFAAAGTTMMVVSTPTPAAPSTDSSTGSGSGSDAANGGAGRGKQTTDPNFSGPGNGLFRQFITGACVQDSDCKEHCCGFKTGLCAGPIIAQERDGGCGFGDASPNDVAAVLFREGKLNVA